MALWHSDRTRCSPEAGVVKTGCGVLDLVGQLAASQGKRR
jgi:hypothetical protein